MRHHKQRSAFTLIELLVVIALILVLAGLAAAFLPSIGENSRVANGAIMVQQMVLTARQKALRDRVACGVRLVTVDPKSGAQVLNAVTTLQYIEQPDDYPLATGPTCTVLPTSLFQAFLNVNVGAAVDTGDYLEIMGNGLVHRISQPPVVGGANTMLTLNSPVPYAFNATTQFRIIRQPRATSDDVVTLPGTTTGESAAGGSVVIDLTTNTNAALTNGNTNPLPYYLPANGYLDILFSPSGQVISQNVTRDAIYLWFRDLSDPAGVGNGPQAILGIYARSGSTAVHPPAPGTDPYQYLKDGRTSGM